MDDVAVYGYIAASKMKIILALSLSDTVVKDAEVANVSPSFTHHPPWTLTSILPRPVDEGVPHGVSICSRKPFPQTARPSRRSQ